MEKDARYLRELIEVSPDPFVVIAPDGMISDVNEATIKATGVSRDKLVGSNFADYFTDPSKAQKGYETVLEQGSVKNYALTLKHISGSLMDVFYNAALCRDQNGNVLGVFAIARDMTELLQAKNKLEQLAKTDPLTGLLNRRAYLELAEHRMKLAKRQKFLFTIMFIDLDGFKAINDEYGHKMGDSVLTHVAESLSKLVRESDLVARFGGDEFVALMEIKTTQDVQVIKEKILRYIRMPITDKNFNKTVDCSIGISIYPHDGYSLDTLLKKADHHMYAHKKKKKKHDK